MQTKGMDRRESALLAALARLKKVEEQLVSIDLAKVSAPNDEIQDGDIVLGVIPEGLRRLWILFHQASVHYAQLDSEYRSGKKTNADGQSIKRLLDEATESEAFLRELLQESFTLQFPDPQVAEPALMRTIVTKDWQLGLRKVASLEFGTGFGVIFGGFSDPNCEFCKSAKEEATRAASS